jgi:V/A-type H+-transporting ATPase subunit D
MEECSPTRTNLLLRRSQVSLARQGVDLLKNKRDVLIAEFMKLMDELVERRHDLEDLSHRAYHSLAITRALDGEETVRSAALATRRVVNVDIRRKKVWGVPIPDVARINLVRPVTERGYSFAGMSARVDFTARHFEGMLTAVVAIAATDVVLRRMGNEIKKTTRRLNALEQVLVPRLLEDARRIRMTLEEREREDVIRLKRMKGRSASPRQGRRGRASSRREAGARPPVTLPAR